LSKEGSTFLDALRAELRLDGRKFPAEPDPGGASTEERNS
jgi:hypothetical protein